MSRWFQRKSNERINRKIRRGREKVMGMRLLVLHTVGRRSGRPHATPLMWLEDGDGLLVVASGGGSRNPDWHANLSARPERVAVELPGMEPVPAAVACLTGADREQAWQLIAAEQPRVAKYQSRSEREYPVIRLTLRNATTGQ
ncbi:nitroreductase family deazaflavin-dependent oxidoreductase [Rhodococcus sp. NPDC047139]|uniref:nitroreductase family deazaflavin-dependent oxidoreductase n=1 Tax=Rhodococcus sp. NPDC047139 TaxID=3155141 RepID=UPI0033DB6D82